MGEAGQGSSGVRRTAGMLRDNDLQVCSLASAFLAETKYTDAIPELIQAVVHETDPKIKKEMSKKLKRLEKIRRGE
ncbi:MAG: hypothetical protein J7K46_04635 [Bacteroidales bacterium]|nr:hypothetical protein [Bacteroidales bacterium]